MPTPAKGRQGRQRFSLKGCDVGVNTVRLDVPRSTLTAHCVYCLLLHLRPHCLRRLGGHWGSFPTESPKTPTGFQSWPSVELTEVLIPVFLLAIKVAQVGCPLPVPRASEPEAGWVFW
jgi:hypothetical protein